MSIQGLNYGLVAEDRNAYVPVTAEDPRSVWRHGLAIALVTIQAVTDAAKSPNLP
jgi:hypothetical protein